MANLKDTIVLGKLNVTDQVTANKFIKLGGSSSQFLLANGDVTGIKTVNGSSIIGSGNITAGVG